jgi:major membrane immunogen (membrane-anchored lipoprotein)
MQKNALLIVCFLAFLMPAAFAGVSVSAPSNNSTVSSPVHYSASAGSTSCSKGVASMGIYTSPGVLAYVVNAKSISTSLTLSPGTYNTTVEQWDYCGGAASTNVTITVSGSTGVFVTSPANNSTVSSPVNFKATATTTCSKGVASMGIYTAPNQKAYVGDGASLNTNLTLSAGTYNTTVEEWDNCGGATSTPVTITVSGGSGGGSGSTLSNLQNSAGWAGYGELPPNYGTCTNCGSGITYSSKQGITSPSLSGKAMEFNIGGKTAYADALWNNHLIGDNSSQGLPDTNHTLVPSLHNFTYDVYFYGTDLALAENLEFDIGQFFDGNSLMFGTQCQIVNGSVWGIWDNVSGRWIDTSAPCKPLSNSWNHLTIVFERTSSNDLEYKTITLNGVTNTLNATYSPGSCSQTWNGVVVNFQLDGNYKQSAYTVYLDNLSVTYY